MKLDDEIHERVAILECRVDVLRRQVLDHENATACIPEDYSTEEYVRYLRFRIDQLQGWLEGVPEWIEIAEEDDEGEWAGDFIEICPVCSNDRVLGHDEWCPNKEQP